MQLGSHCHLASGQLTWVSCSHKKITDELGLHLWLTPIQTIMSCSLVRLTYILKMYFQILLCIY